METSPVLFLNTWYPNREDPWLGLFIRKHARALSLKHPVICLYVKSASVGQIECEWEESPGYLALKAYYPRVASGVPVLGSFIRVLAYPWFSYQAWRILKRKAGISMPSRVVMNVTGPLAWLAAFLKIRYAIPLYWIEHWNAYLPGDPRFSGLNIRLQAWILQLFSSSTAAVSSFLAQGMKNHGLGKKLVIIPNVVDAAFFDLKPKKTSANIRLAHISNFAPFKQADKILEAVNQVMQERQDFVFEFMGLECPAKEALKQRASRMGLYPGKISFLPPLPEKEMPAYLSELCGIVAYSTMESQGVVLLEAWAAGLPAIGNPNMGAWENGPDFGKISANPKDLYSLKQAIHHLLDQVPEYNSKAISNHLKHQVSEQAVGEKLRQWLGIN